MIRQQLFQNKKKNESLKGQIGDLGKNMASFAKDNKNLSNELKKAKAKAEAQQKICDELEKAFKEKKVAVKVDKKKGEVVIPFDDSFFAFDSSKLNTPMKNKLAQVIPVFANTIFNNEQYRDQIKLVQIIGYSSPVYQGEYMNPRELDSVSRDGLLYNMDLSYRRALSIFKFIFDPTLLVYQHQKILLRHTRVASNSYIVSELTPLKTPRSAENLESLSKGRRLCLKYNCNAWQKVAIKFKVN